MSNIAVSVANELRVIPAGLRELEPGLYRTRWFDQRRMIPSRATMAFVDAYERIYREKYAKVRDLNAARTMQVLLASGSLFESNNLIPFWRARQEADRLSCRYDFYLRFVFDRTFNRGWRYLPNPNQLLSEEISLDLEVAWLKMQRDVLQLATNAIYRNENYCALPEQDAYHLYLVQQVEARPARAKVLARLLFKERMLPVNFAIKAFGKPLVEEARFCR